MGYRGVLKEHATLLSGLLHSSDWGATLLAAWVAYRIYFGNWDLSAEYFVVVAVVVLLVALLFPHFHLYRAWRGASILDEVVAITLAWTMVLFLLFAFVFYTKMGSSFSRGWIGTWALLGWSALASGRVLLRMVLHWLRSHGFNQRRIVIVGTEGLGEEVARRLLASPWIGLQVKGFFNTSFTNLVEPGVPILGGLHDIADYVAVESIDQVWIAMPLKELDQLELLLNTLRNSAVDIRFIPDVFSFRLLNHSVAEVAGFPVMNLSVTPMDGVNRLIKALEDRVLALLLLLLLSPLLLLIALCIKFSSHGSVLIQQKRMGWDGRHIMVYKFRSMEDQQEGSSQLTHASNGDAHVTPFGEFLRRTALDELPQLFNVLQGSMSIVGPRPHSIERNNEYKDLVDDYMLRYKVKPGITGWAQIHGWRGETETIEKMRKRVEYDLYYIENWSLWLDLRIILLTVSGGTLLAVLMLAALLPILLLVAVLIRFFEGSPIFYMSRRFISEDKSVTIFKFRTMVRDATSSKYRLKERFMRDGYLDIPLDCEAYTPIGRFLERSQLVETLQLFNILFDGMKLVGNRPLPKENIELLKKFDGWQERFDSPAGITGIAQIVGKFGLLPQQRLYLERMYASIYKNPNGKKVLCDLLIIWHTILLLLTRRYLDYEKAVALLIRCGAKEPRSHANTHLSNKG